MVAGSAGFAAKGSARGVDLSRFEDSDSDGAMDVDVGGEGDAVGEDATSDDEGSDGSDGSDGCREVSGKHSPFPCDVGRFRSVKEC